MKCVPVSFQNKVKSGPLSIDLQLVVPVDGVFISSCSCLR